MDISQTQKRMKMIEDYKEENRKAREMLNSALENDGNYMLALAKAKEAAQEKKRIRDEIMGLEENEKLNSDIKDNREEIKVLEEILAGELMEYYHKNNSTEIPDTNGENRKFKLVVKFLPVKKLY